MKLKVGPLAARVLTSDLRRRTLHAKAEVKRRLSGKPRTLHYFHQVSDPYSHLMVQVLPELAQRFGLTLQAHVIDEIQPDMLPEPEMLKDYGLKDAKALAQLYDLALSGDAQHGTDQEASSAGAHLALVAQTDPSRFFEEAARVGDTYWNGKSTQMTIENADWAKEGEAVLAKLGHYLPGTVWFGGEWYWGLDRLDHLESRLIKAGLGQGPVMFDKTWNGIFEPLPTKPKGNLPPLELYFSARSPYSYISLFQARKFADAMGLELQLFPVLPMVMRNMKVPFRKRLYIVTDTKREATKAGLPFGNIADPLGVGIERAYAIADWIRKTHPDHLEKFFRSALKGITSEGLDVATDDGLRPIVERAGLNWSKAKQEIGNTAWQEWVKDNRDAMTRWGLWGVPCLRFGDVTTWGQDRFWVIRHALKHGENPS